MKIDAVGRRSGGLWLGGAVLAVALAGCGGKPALPTLHFHSRPDLTPPPITVLKSGSNAATGDVFIAPKHDAPAKGPEIFDSSGQLIWFDPVAGPDQATDFRVQTYQGKPVLTWWEGPVASPILGTGFGHYVIMDSSYKQVARVESGLGKDKGDIHEFQLTSQGTALITIYKVVNGSLAALGGAAKATIADSGIQEIDVATGKVLFTWWARDHVGLDESYIPVPAPGSDLAKAPYDYFHINSVEEEPDGNFLISARNSSAIYEIDSKTGEILWRLGGKKSDFQMGPGTTFWWQHDARRRADGTITLYDDGAAPPKESQSRAIRLKIDVANKAATLAGAFTHPAKVLAGSQGNFQLLSNGDAFVGWGAIPRTTEFAPDGSVDFDATFPGGEDSYRAYRFDWTGTPATRPAIAAAKGVGGEKTIYASWNGATGVASWVILACDPHMLGEDKCQAAGQQQRTGFETTLRADVHAPMVAVRALDANGTVLGTSAAVPIDGGSSTG